MIFIRGAKQISTPLDKNSNYAGDGLLINPEKFQWYRMSPLWLGIVANEDKKIEHGGIAACWHVSRMG